jgi:hypothetical protein
LSYIEEFEAHGIKFPKKDRELLEKWFEVYGKIKGYAVPEFMSYRGAMKYVDAMRSCGDLLPEGEMIPLWECNRMSGFIVYYYGGASKGNIYHVFHEDIGDRPDEMPLKEYFKYCEKAFKIGMRFNDNKGYLLKDDALEGGQKHFATVSDVYEFLMWTHAGYQEKAKINFKMPVPDNRLPLREDLVDSLLINPELSRRLLAIDWFSHCGEENVRCPFGVKYVKSFEDACKFSSGLKWENLLLEMQNNLHCGIPFGRKTNWNEFVQEMKRTIMADVENNVSSAQRMKEETQDKEIWNNVKYMTLQCILADHFRPISEQMFCEHLLNICEQGYLPCGWDGNYPLGKLIVY